ncbi:hypothetical protein [Pseudarthrobacter sp. NamE5]|uniref:hypothetical protein n=1 Tax=Pseudarthrobacter sp. NamE5 TaxID=2576839 RepID=UPI00110A7143|nr:hypothetical protein [Pseudarthrobacter sp. NamE5]TLM87659.1 hypothetical protein FDW84_03460 [Pseudarthrobacter sp. NamE5]
MFSIFIPEGEPWYSPDRRAVDAERDIVVQLKNLTGRAPGKAFVLTHGDMTVPFHTAEWDGTDPKTGDWYFASEIVSFGTSIYLKGDRDVPDYAFGNDEEARRWRRIAAEALLVFGRDYNGFKYPQEQVRVMLNDELLTRWHFGYDG